MSSSNSVELRPKRPMGAFHWIDNEVLHNCGTRIGAHGYAVYGILAEQAWMGAGRCRRLSHSKIGAPLGLSVSSVRRALKCLADSGLIRVIYNIGDECDYLLLAVKKRSQHRESTDGHEAANAENPPSHSTRTPAHVEHTNKEEKEFKHNSYKKNANPLPDEKRFLEVRAYIELSYQRHNDIDFCPWETAEQRALYRFLRSAPKLTTSRAKLCVDNYFESVVNTADFPRKWIPQLLKYLASPLDEFNKPLYLTGERVRRSAAASAGRY